MPEQKQAPTTISSWARAILTAFEAQGLESEDLARRAGLPKELLQDPSARIDTALMSRLWELAIAESGDDCLGLKAASFIRPTTLHALGFSILVSENMRDSFERIQRFQKVVSNVIELTLESKDGLLIIELSASRNDVTLSDQIFDMVMAAGLIFARSHLNESVCPVRVEFKRGQPASLTLHNELFGSGASLQSERQPYLSE